MGFTPGPAGHAFSTPTISGSGFGITITCKDTSKEEPLLCEAANGDGGNGGGRTGDSQGQGGGGSNGDGGDGDEIFLDLASAQAMAAMAGLTLPTEYAAAAAENGLRASILKRYLQLASGGFFTSLMLRTFPAFRDRLIADRLFFFKIGAEVAIDSGCATVAELQKRGDEFWDEFEFYLSDLLVGLVLDVVLVTLIAPVAVYGRKPKLPISRGPLGKLRLWGASVPAAMFEKSTGGRKYTFSDRAGCFVARGLEYSLAGIICGVIGQGVASGMMQLRRRYASKPDQHAVAVPPVFETGLVWGMFMALSSNTRYQIVFGLERVVDETIARRIPSVAYFTTLGIRFINNVIGGEQFIDMARWANIQ